MSLEDDLKLLQEKYGITFGPDTGHGPYHRAFVNVVPIPDTKAGKILTLECGHMVQAFGDLRHANGKVLCAYCQKEAEKKQR
jgi:hypothetical protein